MYAALLAYILGLLTGIKNQPKSSQITDKTQQQNTDADHGPIVVTSALPPLSDEERAEKKEKQHQNIVGCVDYTVSFSGEHHQTYFIYDLWGTSDAGRIERLVMGVNTPADKIKFFTNSPFSGGAN